MPTLQNLIKAAGGIISQLLVIMMAVALLVFFWGLVRFIFRVGGDEKAVAEGRNTMIWGLVTLFIMVSVWGLVKFIQSGLGIPNVITL